MGTDTIRQIRVTAGSFQRQLRIVSVIDKQPIRLYVEPLGECRSDMEINLELGLCFNPETASELGIHDGQWVWDEGPVGLTGQCTLCSERQAEGKLPACVKHCQANCIQIMNVEDAATAIGKISTGPHSIN